MRFRVGGVVGVPAVAAMLGAPAAAPAQPASSFYVRVGPARTTPGKFPAILCALFGGEIVAQTEFVVHDGAICLDEGREVYVVDNNGEDAVIGEEGASERERRCEDWNEVPHAGKRRTPRSGFSPARPIRHMESKNG